MSNSEIITALIARLDETNFVMRDGSYDTEAREALARLNGAVLKQARAWLADAKTAKEERA